MNDKFPFNHFLKMDHLEKNKQEIAAQEKKTNEELKPQDDFSTVELSSINSAILSYLKEVVTPQKYITFFDNFKLISLKGSSITFQVNAPFIKTMILTHHTAQIKEAINNILGKNYDLKIDISSNSNESLSSNKNNILHALGVNHLEPEKLKNRPKNAVDASFILKPTSEDLQDQADSKYFEHMNPSESGMLIDPKKTFESFVVGPSNNMAYATALSVADNPGKTGKYPTLYFYSSSGLGKTHLLHAVANRIKEKNPQYIICLITGRDFMKEMIGHIQEKKLPEFQKKYSEKIDVLMIDDIHELKNKKGTQDELFHIFNELYHKGKQLIFTSDKDPREIDGIEERIKTRLQWGLVIDIQMPDLETRIAILKKKAYELDLFLSEDVINLVATHIKTSIRELEGSLVRLSAISEILETEIDVEMVKEQLMLKDNNLEENGSINLDAIAKATSNSFKITQADLKSKSRNKEITQARHVAMYLSQKIVGATLIEIGKYYGGRDHASVIHAINKTKDLLKTDSALSKMLVTIEKEL